MKNLNITIVGAGGGASYLLPQLIRLCAPINRLTIYDKDTLESRNLDRQLFADNLIGQNKGEALAETLKLKEWVKELQIRQEWFMPGTGLPSDETVVFSCVDNHPARKAILDTVDRMALSDLEEDVDKSPFALVAGNEYFDSEGYIYFPMWRGGIYDPRITFPEINTITEGDPASCQGDEQVANPQLAIANARSADHVLQLLYTWHKNYISNLHTYSEEALDAVYNNLPYYIRVGEYYNQFVTTEERRKEYGIHVPINE